MTMPANLPELPDDLIRAITEHSPSYDEGLRIANMIRAYALATRPQAASDGEDGRRLDWLETFAATSAYTIDELFGSGGSRRYVSLRDKDSCDDEVLGQGPTLRAAIDAAMTTDAAKGEGK